MTAKKLIEHEKANWRTYADLAERCRSVPELLLKLDAYGKVWTRWDWVLFFKYLYVQNQRVSPSGWLSLN